MFVHCSIQKIQYGRVSAAENGPLSSNCILLPRTLCLTLAFSMELYVKPLSPHTNANTPACMRTRRHTLNNTLVEERIKGETESRSGGGVTNLLFLCLERLEEMSEGCKIILTGRIKTLIHARAHKRTHGRAHRGTPSLLHPHKMTSRIRWSQSQICFFTYSLMCFHVDPRTKGCPVLTSWQTKMGTPLCPASTHISALDCIPMIWCCRIIITFMGFSHVFFFIPSP